MLLDFLDLKVAEPDDVQQAICSEGGPSDVATRRERAQAGLTNVQLQQ